MKSGKVRIATRSSELALMQSRIVEKALEKLGIETELVTFKTAGDKRHDEPLSDIGAKGLFTHELELALAKNKVDCAVHSLKDLPTKLPDGLAIGAVLEREDPRDAVVISGATEAEDLTSLPAGSRVGTSSLRCRAQLLAQYPHLEVADLHGTVPTLLRKVDAGKVHAAILTAAGLIRLGAQQRIRQYLEAPVWLPAAGQGAIAIEIRSDDEEMRELCATLHHHPTGIAVRAERAFLDALEGGCQVPIGALSSPDESGTLVLHGFISDLRGREMIRGSIAVDENVPEESGRALAADLRTRGASSLLMDLRNSGQLIAPQPE